MIRTITKIVLGAAFGVSLVMSSPAFAGFVCQHSKTGDVVEVFGVSVPQENGAGLLEKGDGYLIQIQGKSEGQEIDSYLYITEGLRQKLARCSPQTQEVVYRVRCLERGEPEVIQAVC